VTEGARHDLDVDVGGQHEGGSAVAQVVEPDRLEAGGGDEPLEEVGHLAGVEPGAVFLGEDVAGLDPGRAPLLAVRVLPFAVPLEDVDGVVIERDHLVAAVGLGIGCLDFPAVLHELGRDGEGVGGQLGVLIPPSSDTVPQDPTFSGD
jgi:hypothetical protein